MPEGLSEPVEAFIHYLLEQVGDEFEARVADADSPDTTLTSTAEGNRSHIRSLKDLHYLWKHYHERCGALRRIASLKYKASYAGEYAEAECVGERSTSLVRVTFNRYDGRIDGCWLTEFPAPPTYPPVVYARTNAACGRGMSEFLHRLYCLTLDIRVVERGDSPRRLDCSFDVWLRAHPFHWGAVGAQPYVQDRAGYIWRRVNPEYHFVKASHDLKRCRIQGLQPGTYRVAARVRGCPGSMVSPELVLDGAQQETEVVIPLPWAQAVEVVIQDTRNNEPLNADDLQLFLGGWRWRAWRVHPWERTVSYWGANSYETDRLRYQDGRFSLGKMPAGEYLLGFTPPGGVQDVRDARAAKGNRVDGTGRDAQQVRTDLRRRAKVHQLELRHMCRLRKPRGSENRVSCRGAHPAINDRLARILRSAGCSGRAVRPDANQHPRASEADGGPGAGSP